MFGLDKMTHSGTAKVVSCELSEHGYTYSDSFGRSTDKFELILDVYPDGRPAFRTEVHERFGTFKSPRPGDALKVRCNPDKKTVEIDLSEDARFNPKLYRKANDLKRKEERDRILSAAPGTPAVGRPAGAPDGSAGVEDPELAELLRLEEEERGTAG